MNIQPSEPQKSAKETIDYNHFNTLSTAFASWFVRLDNSFFDVDDIGHKRSRADVERTALVRFMGEYPEIKLTPALVGAVFKRVIRDQHTDVTQTIMPWNGRVACVPGVDQRVIIDRGTATINTWKKPAYRNLRVNAADYGVAGEFLDWFFVREAERNMFLDWLAWCLQNEGDKPNWAPFFYSSKMGTGKSAMNRLLVHLFGGDNSITQNNVDKLTGRFSMTLLHSKFLVCEEVNLRPGSGDANALKTYITEKTTTGERKGREAERVEQRLCMVLTSNHMPFWIEPEDRRYYIVNIDHDGYARGPRAEDFAALVGRLEEWSEDPVNIASLYNALMARELADGFSAKTLNVDKHGTDIMQHIFGNGRATVLDRLQELLDMRNQHAITEGDVTELVTDKLRANINTTKHLMSDLGWRKMAVKWGGIDYTRHIWVRPGYVVQRGKLHGPDGFEVKLDEHLAHDIELV